MTDRKRWPEKDWRDELIIKTILMCKIGKRERERERVEIQTHNDVWIFVYNKILLFISHFDSSIFLSFSVLQFRKHWLLWWCAHRNAYIQMNAYAAAAVPWLRRKPSNSLANVRLYHTHTHCIQKRLDSKYFIVHHSLNAPALDRRSLHASNIIIKSETTISWKKKRKRIDFNRIWKIHPFWLFSIQLDDDQTGS